MWTDEIVAEVRTAGATLAEQAGNDLHRLCELLRRNQEKHLDRVVKRPMKQRLHAAGRSAR